MINNDREVVEEGYFPTIDDDSGMDSNSEVVWTKSAWKPRHLWEQVVFYWGHPEGEWIAKKLVAPTVPKPPPKPAPKRGK